MELGRAPLKYGFAREFISMFNVHPRWLATGEGDDNPGIKLPTAEEIGLSERALFTAVFDKYLDPIIPKNADRRGEFILGKIMGLKADTVRAIAESTIQSRLAEVLDEIPNDQVANFQATISRLIEESAVNFSKDEWELVLRRRLNRRAARSAQIGVRKKESLTSLNESVKSESVKPLWPLLKERLNKATAEPGTKTKLAKFLGVELASVSQWLTDKKTSAREPGAETALRMLHWVELQERK